MTAVITCAHFNLAAVQSHLVRPWRSALTCGAPNITNVQCTLVDTTSRYDTEHVSIIYPRPDLSVCFAEPRPIRVKVFLLFCFFHDSLPFFHDFIFALFLDSQKKPPNEVFYRMYGIVVTELEWPRVLEMGWICWNDDDNNNKTDDNYHHDRKISNNDTSSPFVCFTDRSWSFDSGMHYLYTAQSSRLKFSWYSEINNAVVDEGCSRGGSAVIFRALDVALQPRHWCLGLLRFGVSHRQVCIGARLLFMDTLGVSSYMSGYNFTEICKN